ncbi:MAG TPA: carbohydrate porin [Burkholderiales bacterium]|nr:carbohydrate porin [Burkholderiales bacterium]
MRGLACIAILCASSAFAADLPESALDVHAQATYIRQYKPSFLAPYSGPHSLDAERASSYTLTGTLFFGARLGDATELYFNAEFVQGLAFSGLLGTGGFANGEIQRTTGQQLRGYRARLFARHTWNLGGEIEEKESDLNQVRTRYAAERFVLTAGNLSVLDIFDVLEYSHDPRTQFMNWSSLTYGAWDYPADARGYTWGLAGEYITPLGQLRVGRFLVPAESNGLRLDQAFMQRYGDVAELEVPYKVAGRSAIARALWFRNRVNSGAFDDAIASGAATGTVPDLSLVRHAQSKQGFGLSTQMELGENLGAYVRAGWSDGKTETFMFTEIDRSLAAGGLVKGGGWGRPEDTVGVAAYINGLSRPHRDYLAAGGLGFFLGDGRLNYATEQILEVFYSLAVVKKTYVSLGYQRIANPGYNRDRGPADFFSLRFHAEL